ncbi:hypothetical protein [uncultured Roseibium sp.]|uniref:hypothetical protein n=1 Tax=uncultured Roseibium sp. TaxID=1936171 RepID=UPI0032174585
MHYRIFVSVLVLLAGLVAVSAQAIDPGEIGGRCLSEDRCLTGICNDRGMCVACGQIGQPACLDADRRPVCTSPSASPAPAGRGGSVCVSDSGSDCGHIGEPACAYENGPFCYYGVASSLRGGGSVCLDCGDYGQPCCPGTDKPCDYGTCQNGTCLPKAVSLKSQILKAIADCRGKDARALIAQLPQGSAVQKEMQAAYDRADRREDEVRALFEQARSLSREARVAFNRGNVTGAQPKLRQARQLLEQARAKTACPKTASALDKGIALVKSNLDKTRAGDAVRKVVDAIKACDFTAAREALAKVSKQDPDYADIRKRYEDARSWEERLRKSYDEGYDLYKRGNQLLKANRDQEALRTFKRAHELFTRVRKETNCQRARDVATAALHEVSTRIERAEAFLKAAKKKGASPPKTSSNMPGRYQPAGGAHPCLDPSVKPTHTAAGYSPLGGGQTTIYIKGKYICDYQGSFSILTGSELVNYHCKREGNRFVECKETDRDTLTNRIQRKGFTTYEFDKRKFWLDVYPVKK